VAVVNLLELLREVLSTGRTGLNPGTPMGRWRHHDGGLPPPGSGHRRRSGPGFPSTLVRIKGAIGPGGCGAIRPRPRRPRERPFFQRR
jgi:hypothetical protein